MAGIDLNIDLFTKLIGSEKVQSELKKMDALMDKMQHRENIGTLKQIENMNKLEARYKKANDLLSGINKSSTKFGEENAKAFDKLGYSIFKALTVVNLLKSGLNMVGNLVSRGFSMAEDFVKESYTKALALNTERSELGARYTQEGKPADRLIASMDKLADNLLYYGINKEDTFKSAKTFETIFPKSNEAAAHNFVLVAGLMSSVFHKPMEQQMQALKMLEGQIAAGTKISERTLLRAGLDQNSAKEINDMLKSGKETGHLKKSYNQIFNDIEEKLYNGLKPMAEKGKIEDPFAYLQYKFSQAQYQFGENLIKVLNTPGIQKMIDSLIDKFGKLVASITPEKIESAIGTVISVFYTFSDAVMSIIEFINDHVVKSDFAVKREGNKLQEFVTDNMFGKEGGDIYKKYAEYHNKFPNKNYTDIIRDLDRYKQEKKSGFHDKNQMNFRKTEKDFFELLINKFKPTEFKFDNSQTVKVPVADREKGASKGLANGDSLSLTNETAGVTGNKPLNIYINIGEQIHEVNINSGSDGKLDMSEIQTQVLKMLDDAINTSEGIAQNY